MEASQRAIVIGASAGGVETLREVVSKFLADLASPVFVVLHIPPFVASALEHVAVDYTLPSTEIGALIGRLVNTPNASEVAVESDQSD